MFSPGELVLRPSSSKYCEQNQIFPIIIGTDRKSKFKMAADAQPQQPLHFVFQQDTSKDSKEYFSQQFLQYKIKIFLGITNESRVFEY